MIPLTRLNHNPVFLNPDLVKSVEALPDSVITLVNGEKLMVLETGAQILSLIIAFRQRILSMGAGS